MILSLYFLFIVAADVSFKEPVELDKLMRAMDECIMFNPAETKAKIRDSRIKALLPEFKLGGRYEENDIEANKLAESSPYLLTNFKNGWAIEATLSWSLNDLLLSKEEINLKKEYQANLEKYISLQNLLSETYYKLKEVLKKLENTKDNTERESLEKEYHLLNARINVLTCHKYKTIHKKED